MLLGALTHTAEAGPAISIQPSPIEFYGGPLYVQIGAAPGEEQQGWYEVRNTGDATLVVTHMAITGADAGLMRFNGAVDPFCGDGQDCAQTFSLAPGESRSFQLACTAAQAGYFAAALGVTSNAASGTGTAPMSCVGLRAPIIQISPPSLDFGIAHRCDVDQFFCDPCPTQPLTQTLTITNAAAPPSRLDFYITPTLPSTVYDDFIVGDMCGADTGGCSLPAGGSRPIEITFRPRWDSLYTAPLTVVSLYPGQPPISIPFRAEGGHGTLAFDSPDFLGSVPIGQTLTTTFTVHNAGRSCLALYGPFSSDSQIQFVGSPPTSLQLHSGQSRSWTLSCTPTAVGTVSAFLDFDVSFESIDLATQFATCEGIGALVVTPAPVSFTGAAAVPVGASATQRVTVRNAGLVPTDLAALTPSDPRFTAALVAGSLPLTLAPDATAEVDITFTPTDTARTSATIAFDATTGGDFPLPVVGDGVLFQADVTPAALDFGSISHPATPTQQIALHNTGTGPLTVNGVSLDLPGDFSVTGIASGATIAAGATLSFEVRATPALLGRRRATLVIDLDRIPDPRIPLDALSIDPALVVTTADLDPTDYELDFGNIDVDASPGASTATLHNTAPTPIAIATCAIAGDPELRITSACPFTIPAHATADLAFSFAPTAEAESAATVTLLGTGFATGSLQLRLRGIGLDPRIALSALSLAFPDTVQRPRDLPTRAITIHNTSTTKLVLSSLHVDNPAFSLLGPASLTLAPGASQDLTLSFAPVLVGDASGHLVIGSADDPQLARVALTGRGISHTLELSPLAGATFLPRAPIPFTAHAADAPDSAPGAGCGCSTGAPASSLPLGAALLLVLRRRRPAP